MAFFAKFRRKLRTKNFEAHFHRKLRTLEKWSKVKKLRTAVLQPIFTGSYKKKTFERDSSDYHSRVEKSWISSNRHSLHLFKNGDIHVSVIFVILQIADSQDRGFVTILISKEIQHLGQRLKSVSSSNASSTTSAISCISVWHTT